MRTCYIGGKMRGLPQYNFPAFFAAEEVLRGQGWEVISPARMDKDAGEESDGKLQTGEISDDQTTRRIVRRDVDAILSLRRENGDAIVLIPGWRTSVGVAAELALARWLHLPVYEINGNHLTLFEFDVQSDSWVRQ